MLKLQLDNITLEQIKNNYYKIYNNDFTYIGEYNTDINGYGKYYDDAISYHGFWINNIFNGKGNIIYNIKNDMNITKYNGDFKDGVKDGYGKEYYVKEYYYVGYFKNDLKEGKGILYKNNNIIFDGLWYNNHPINDETIYKMVDGINTIEYNNISIDLNINITFNDKITTFYDNNKIKYEGKVVNNVYNGFGEYYQLYDDKHWKMYEGNFIDGLFNGKGILYNYDRSIFYKGIFTEGNIAEENVEVKYFYCDRKEKWKFKGIINLKKQIDNTQYNKIFTTYKEYPKIYILQGEKIDYINGKMIIGKWIDDKLNGNVIIYNLRLHNIFKGIIKDDEYVEGIEYYDNGLIKFEGKYSIWGNNNSAIKIAKKYIGKFYNLRNTEYKEGNIIKMINMSDTYMNYKLNDIGKICKKNTSNNWYTYKKGNFKYNNLNGMGEEYDNNGLIKLKGKYVNGLLEGYCIEYKNGLKCYEGNFFNSYRHGSGTIYDDNGNFVLNGRFSYGQLTN